MPPTLHSVRQTTRWLQRTQALSRHNVVVVIVLKVIVEILLAIFLHPLAYILCIINIVTRKDLSGVWKVLWILITFFWGIGPIIYVLFGGGSFW
jgi:hypothetical protein